MGNIHHTPHTQSPNHTYTLSHGCYSFQGRKNKQEDRIQCHNTWSDNHIAIFAVFDGHRGYQCAEYMSAEFVSVLLGNDKFREATSLALMECFEDCDQSFMDLARENEDFSGSTATVLVVVDQTAFIASVGDSSCIVVDGGESVDMTVNHTPDEEEELFRLNAYGCEIHNGRVHGLAVSRGFGNYDIKDRDVGFISVPDVKIWTLQDSTHFFIIASDGLWKVMSVRKVQSFIERELKSGHSLDSIAEHLVKKAYHKGARDNISVVIVLHKRRRH
eukprot:TRINITY_DN3026_c0_g1_i1.p1 TRINITY_DN3026_c0_g1~~TRINITY_DN3026_c0_g1_i1.p1  ORF type:complete len:274 (+),score=47.04 TRINITY_DN3026_c0_g1_i1:41-862(+)